jgi:general nucleoside transport system ATP-binding protein
VTQPLALSLRGIHKQFGAVRALHDVTLDVRAGTVHALLGENGAGKSTLMRVAFGLVRADRGTVAVHSTALTATFSPAMAIAAGVGMVHQHFSLVSAMTVSENIALGAHGRYDPATVHAQVQRIGVRTGLALDPAARVGDLPVSAQQRCEIVKALARAATVLILDEPTAVLAPDEAQALLAWLRAFVAEHPSHAVVLITHKLRDALAVADDITVLRRGERVAMGAASAFTEASLADAMLGPGTKTEAMQQELVPQVAPHADSVGAHHHVITVDAIEVRDARGALRVRGASFAVRAGEIVGVAAVEGSGQHELLRAVAGLLPIAQGRLGAPDDIAFVPEDRHRDALLLDASLAENLALRDAGARRGRMDWRTFAARTTDLLARRDVRARDARVPARTLSGGNQQKFILARALDDAPPALVVENPTRGLDFRATAAVHEALRDARDAGIAILLYSSDLDEVLALADRVLALHNGVVHEVPRDRAVVGRAMLGAA